MNLLKVTFIDHGKSECPNKSDNILKILKKLSQKQEIILQENTSFPEQVISPPDLIIIS